jgi:energy-converting hydrogenase Eha subunit E
MEDYKQAALNMFPTDWIEVGGAKGLKIDRNANIRLAAERILKPVFEILNSESTACNVADAFVRRAETFGLDDKSVNTAMMSTALMAAVIDIRDNAEDQSSDMISLNDLLGRNKQGGAIETIVRDGTTYHVESDK